MAINTASLYGTPPDAQALGQQANQAVSTASNYQTAASLLPAQLKQAIEQKLNYNSDIIDQQSKAQANYFAAPAEARQQYQGIFNPFDREALVARSVANAYAPYQSLTDILGQRQGNIADTVNAGVGAFQSGVSATGNAANDAQTQYQNAIALLDKIANAQQFDYSANKSGGTTLDQSGVLDALFGGQQQSAPAIGPMGPSLPGYQQGSADTIPNGRYTLLG